MVGENAQIRLPTEWEWQWAAQNGEEARQHPWGELDDKTRANTTEAGINDRSTAVGMYPHGATECGALDMGGNLWEWCMNERDDPEQIQVNDSDNSRVLRGGCFSYFMLYAAAASRYYGNPYFGSNGYGVRLCLSAPIIDL